MRDRFEEMTMTTASSRGSAARVLTVSVIAACLALAISLFAAGAARADFGLDGPFIGTVSTLQAGAHPDARTAFTLTTNPDGTPQANLKEVQVDLPQGLVGNPQAVPQCSMADLAAYGLAPFFTSPECPRDTMIGTVKLTMSPGTFLLDSVTLPVFNMKPQNGEPAAFAFNAVGFGIVRLDASVRSGGDYGLTVNIHDITEQANVVATDLTLWGVPADHNGPGPNAFDVVAGGSLTYGGQGGGPRVAFLTNPVQCGVQDAPSISISSWQEPSTTVGPTKSDPQQVTGCDKLQFNPTITVRPDNQKANSPAGVNVDIGVPQNDSPDGLATPPLRDVSVALPAGMAINPSAADGLQGCTNDQVGIGNTTEPACPAASRIGTVSVHTPLLADPLTGSIYLGQPLSNDSRTGQMFRVFLDIEGSGIVLKLQGSITPDPNTGQLTATFLNNPQLPFDALHLRFQGGPRAPLTTPPACGTYTTTTSMTSWDPDIPAATPSDSFVINQNPNGGPCAAAGFSPSFSAGTVNPTGGKFSPFTLTFGRSDSDQTLKDIAVTMPPGLLANISSAVLCPDSAAANGTCEDVSKIGTATTSAGTGSNPFSLPGQVYITGPYEGAPFGLSIVVPAVAGPFNLGTVVVRAAIFVDKHTAALRIVSDPLPTILDGIPLNIRSVNINVDRPNFMFNPTTCSPMSVGATIDSNSGAAANVSSRFQVGSCASLPFKPKMTISAGGKGHTGARASTPLKVVVAMPKGDTNLKTADVTLPSSLNAHLQALQHPCSQADFDSDKCGALAKVGTASAVTPVLRDPLRGGVFFVTNPRRGALPFMEVQLRGQVAVDLRAVIKTTPLVETRFENIPDVPISKFTLNLVSGKQGPVGVRTNLCAATSKAKTAFRAQNGKLVQASPKIAVAGCAKKLASKTTVKKAGSTAKAKHAMKSVVASLASATAASMRG